MIVSGGPRTGGSTSFLAGVAAEAAEGAGATVDLVRLGDVRDLRGCASCYACLAPGAGGCVIRDGLGPILARLRERDALLILSPVYWFSYPAQVKAFIDRAFFSMNGPGPEHLFRGRDLGLVLGFGDEDPLRSGAGNVARSFQDLAAKVGARVEGIVHGRTEDPEATARDGVLLARVRALAARMGGQAA